MTLELTARDRALLNGTDGEGAALAMRILARMAEIVGAPRLLDISMAHIDSALFKGDATLEYAERLADGGARVAVPSTLNVAGVDVHAWEDWDVPSEWAAKARRQMDAYERMGCKPTWTCAPYQTEARPAFGQQIAWGESSAIVFANSVLGARTERYPDLLDICCAITGRAPAVGLHLEENRAGQILLRFDEVPVEIQESEEFPAVLGHWVGRVAGSRVPVLAGLSLDPTEDQLKALGAAMASSGAVALFHWVGVTPEAPDVESALQGRPPPEERSVTVGELARARAELTSAEGEALDLVVLGSPHFSLDEFRTLAPLLEGRRRAPEVRFLVTCGRGVKAIAEAAGLFDPLREFGAEVTVDTCILTTPMLPADVQTLMTNSAKFAYYTPGLLARTVTFGSLSDCVESAVRGTVVRARGAWDRVAGAGPAGDAAGGARQDARGDAAGDARGDGNDVDRRVGPGAVAGAVRGTPILSGEASGRLLVTREPLSFWGGYDPVTGEITDRTHPLSGVNAAGAILALPETRGSSTTTAVLLESIRAGTAPVALITRGVDSFLALAGVVAQEMYGITIPVLSLEPADFDALGARGRVCVHEDGTLELFSEAE